MGLCTTIFLVTFLPTYTHVLRLRSVVPAPSATLPVLFRYTISSIYYSLHHHTIPTFLCSVVCACVLVLSPYTPAYLIEGHIYLYIQVGFYTTTFYLFCRLPFSYCFEGFLLLRTHTPPYTPPWAFHLPSYLLSIRSYYRIPYHYHFLPSHVLLGHFYSCMHFAGIPTCGATTKFLRFHVFHFSFLLSLFLITSACNSSFTTT